MQNDLALIDMFKLVMQETHILEILIKATAPFITLLIIKLIFRHHIKLNISYFLLALIIAFYLQMFSIPVVGFWNNVKAIMILSYFYSPLLFGLCFLGNVCWQKLKSFFITRYKL